ncbi:MAG: hypothetical protein K9H61_05960 [Bacteroidia bacterium]|nr:hypothetical protein [Bacteroidia bacterium]MCF8425255.1 hypothetical protein [Bacteroidia bacterium]MCF8446523.1 hypothetical protein [Bacteroidia bacterium]
MEKNNCHFCQHPLAGRKDKKFCDDHCRSAFNNQVNSSRGIQMKKVNAILRKNRTILENLFAAQTETETTLVKRKFQELGFVFNFHTHIEELEEGKTCYFCYEYGYIPLNNSKLAVIKLN